MADTVTTVYLALMFFSMYMFFFFIIITVKNRKEFFSYPVSKKIYTVSIVVPCYNEADSIKDNVMSILATDYKGFKKVIVVDDCSTDDSWKVIKALARKYKKVMAVQTPKNTGNAAGAKNYGAKFVKTDLIGFSDADSHPNSDAVRKLAGYFDDPKMGAVTSYCNVKNRKKNFLANLQALEYMLLGWNRKITDFIRSVYVTTGPLSLYRSKFFFEINGFDEKSMTEDIEITWNMISKKWNTAMCLDARVVSYVPTKFKTWFRQRQRWGIGGLQTIAKYKRYFFKQGIFGYFIIPFVTLTIILSVFTFIFSWFLMGKMVYTKLLSVGYSIAAETAIFQTQSFNLYPSVMIFYSLVLFTTSMIYYHYILHRTKYEEKISIKRFLKLVFFALLFLTLYPVVWFFAIYRYVKRDYKWH